MAWNLLRAELLKYGELSLLAFFLHILGPILPVNGDRSDRSPSGFTKVILDIIALATF